MNNVVMMQTPSPMRPRDYNPQQLALIQRTYAKDTTRDEFDMFIEISRRAGLDPFRKQIYCAVYNKDNPEKRKVVFMSAIDGLRAVAARNRDYRPDDQESEFDIDEDAKGPANPQGLRKAVVRVYKLAPNNQWHPVVGTAYWSEFAPMKTDGADGFTWEKTDEIYTSGPKKGKPKYRKVMKGDAVEVPDGKWASMPHVMLAKCAEAQALRKGWPEDLSGIYVPEEMDQAMVDITPTDAIAQHETQLRLERVNATNAVPILWETGKPIEYVPLGQMADRALAFIQSAESATQIDWWSETNTGGLREFWALSPTDALAVKKAREARIAELSA